MARSSRGHSYSTGDSAGQVCPLPFLLYRQQESRRTHLSGHLDPYRIVPHLDPIASEPQGGMVEGIAGLEVEFPAVTRAGEHAVLHPGLIQRGSSVGTAILHRVETASHVEEEKFAMLDLDQPGLPGGQVQGAGNLDMVWHGLDFLPRTADVSSVCAV